MRIGIYTPYLDTLTGGEKYILTAAVCLSKHHQVSFFWDKNREEIKEEIASKFDMNLESVTFTENIFDRKVSFLKRYFASKAFDRIIVLSDGSIPFIGTKLILHFQTPMEWVNTSSIKTKIKLSRVYKTICNSMYTKRYIDREFHITSDVIYPPVTIDVATEYKKENIILNVGRYGITQAGSSYKKQEFLIDSFKKLYDSGATNWKLLVVVSIFDSDKEKLTLLHQKIAEYPIEIIANPSNKMLWEMYKKARIYWHAAGYGEDLEKNPDRAEHFGIATVEAMGAGAVPIVINAGGQSEIVQNDKNGLTWNTQAELLQKTEGVIKNKTLWEELSTAAKKRALDFSKDIFASAWGKTVL